MAFDVVTYILSKKYTDKRIEDIAEGFRFKGEKDYKEDLPTSGNENGDIWTVLYRGTRAEGGTDPWNAEFAWAKAQSKWVELGTDYDGAIKQIVDALVQEKAEREAGKILGELREGQPYNLPYYFSTTSKANKVVVKANTVSLDGNKTQGEYTLDVLPATDTTAGIMSASDATAVRTDLPKAISDEAIRADKAEKELQDNINKKQNILTAGPGIDITNDVISNTGGPKINYIELVGTDESAGWHAGGVLTQEQADTLLAGELNYIWLNGMHRLDFRYRDNSNNLSTYATSDRNKTHTIEIKLSDKTWRYSHDMLALSSELSAEISNRTTADTTLQTNITNEVNAREAAINAVNASIGQEVTAREQADTTLQNNIDKKVDKLTTQHTNTMAYVQYAGGTEGVKDVTSAIVGWSIMERDNNGLTKVATVDINATDGTNVANANAVKNYAVKKVNNNTNYTLCYAVGANGSTSMMEPMTALVDAPAWSGVERDGNGFINAKDPTAGTHVATKTYTDSKVSTEASNRIAADNALDERVSNVEARGRFLSIWSCVNGLPETEPTTIPYLYKAGDYYIVGAVNASGQNARPDGSSYTGVASLVVESRVVKVGDYYTYDGTNWTLLENSQRTITFNEIAGRPTTISGYGITDAKIQNGVITLGDKTITPLTEHQSIKTINGNDLVGSGNVTITTYKPFPSSWPVTQGTTIATFCAAVNASYKNGEIKIGDAFLGNVNSIPFFSGAYVEGGGSLGSAEVSVQIMTPFGQNCVQLLTTTSSNNAPYHWEYTYVDGAATEGWRCWTNVKESTVSGWGFTKNTGTITGITMNGSSKGTSGNVDLGTVITEHQSLKTINGSDIKGTGNVEVKTYQPFPNGSLSGTLQEVVTAILAFPTKAQGMAYLGSISGSCTPFSYGNVECTVTFMTSSIAVLSCSSSNIAPYHWEYNTAQNDYQWRAFLVENNVKTVNGNSIIGTGDITISGGSSDYTQLTNKPTINNVELNGNKTTSDLGLSTVSVSSTGTATDEVSYITINGVEKKIAGGGSDIPTPPTTDGEYVLKVVVSSGTPTTGWVADTYVRTVQNQTIVTGPVGSNSLPPTPSTDDDYLLHCSVVSGVATIGWANSYVEAE